MKCKNGIKGCVYASSPNTVCDNCKLCPDCGATLEQTYIGRYKCPVCKGTYYESDLIKKGE